MACPPPRFTIPSPTTARLARRWSTTGERGIAVKPFAWAADTLLKEAAAMPELTPLTVAFLLYPGVTQLDLTGPAQFLSRLGNVTIHLVAASREPVPTDAGFSILPTATFDEVRSADILCVPGGITCIDVMEDDTALAWVRAVAADAQWVTSVCTGSLILGAAGLLRGYRAACHWAWRDQLPLFGAEAVAERVVFDRNRVTGGGVTAGIDFALALTAAIRGEAHARLVQLALEYDPAPPFDSGAPERASPEMISFYRNRMEQLAPGRAERVRAAATRASPAWCSMLLRNIRNNSKPRRRRNRAIKGFHLAVPVRLHARSHLRPRRAGPRRRR